MRALADFKDGRVTALVATEVAARGLDIKELPYVVNYELPNVPEDYVHRIGRTARAGGTGNAVSLVSHDEAPLLRDIESLLKMSLPVAPVPQFEIRPGTGGAEPAREAQLRRGPSSGAAAAGQLAAQAPHRRRARTARAPRATTRAPAARCSLDGMRILPVAIAWLLLTGSSCALAHAHLTHSAPAEGAHLAAAPRSWSCSSPKARS